MKTIITVCFALLLFLILYDIFPTLYFLLFAKPPFSLDKSHKRIMLTFDDGPDPRYTGRLLDVLKKNHVQATFFVVAKKAAENPEILERMKRDGHLVGLHSLEHRDAWLKSPAYQKKDFGSALPILRAQGQPPLFYRAPWGHLNLTALVLARKHHLRIVLWTVMAQDWEKASTAQRVMARLRKRVRNGSIICLHDSGCGKGAAPGAPARTIEAVSEFIPMMKEKGYEFVLPDSCSTEKVGTGRRSIF